MGVPSSGSWAAPNTGPGPSVFKDHKSEAREVEWLVVEHKWPRQASCLGLLTLGLGSFLLGKRPALPFLPGRFSVSFMLFFAWSVVFQGLREILLECPVPSPSKFPALFNCSPEIPTLLGGAQEAVKEFAKNGATNKGPAHS